MFYNKKYPENKDKVLLSDIDREDRIEEGFNNVEVKFDEIDNRFDGIDDITTSLSDDVNALNDFKDKITIRIHSQGVNFSGKTSNGGDLWIGNPGTNNALLVVNLKSVNGQSSAPYRVSTYLTGNAAYIRLFNSSGAAVTQADVILNYVIYLL